MATAELPLGHFNNAGGNSDTSRGSGGLEVMLLFALYHKSRQVPIKDERVGRGYPLGEHRESPMLDAEGLAHISARRRANDTI